MRQVRIATDTELFVGRMGSAHTLDGMTAHAELAPFPICGSVGGSKEHPIPIPGIEEKGYLMQEDNVTLEFNIPPCTSGLEFVDKVNLAVARLSSFCKTKGLTIIKNKSATLAYPALLEEGAQRLYPGAFQIGCSPDYWAYSENVSQPRDIPNLASFKTDRFAGMHFHVSYDNPHGIPEWVFVRFIDLFVNMNMMTYDTQGRRREFYGLAGLYRPTKYPDGSTGLEYRSHGSALVFNQSILNRVVTGILHTIEDVNNHPQEASSFFAEIPWKDVASCIHKQDLEMAATLYHISTKAKWHRHMGWLNRDKKQEIYEQEDDLEPPRFNLEAVARAAARVRRPG